jgi:hypothetical protein
MNLITPPKIPPSKATILVGSEFNNRNETICYQAPYFSKPGDIPPMKAFGGASFNIPCMNLEYLQEFDPKYTIPQVPWKTKKTFALVREEKNAPIPLTTVRSPPSRKEILISLKSKEEHTIPTTKPVVIENRKANKFASSQIDGATQQTYGFAFSLDVMKKSALLHTNQHLTLLSLEIHGKQQWPISFLKTF